MIGSIRRSACALATLTFLSGALAACGDPVEGAGEPAESALAPLAEAGAALEASRAAPEGDGAERGTYFHDEVHPPHWLPWTTDGAAPVEAGAAFLTHGLRCRGRYCDDVSLLAVESGYAHTSSAWTDYFSEEGANERVCPNNGFVTGIRCAGDFCDSVSLRCSQVNNGGVRANCYWTAPVSDESGGKFVAPESTYVAGVRCGGRYCDNKQLFLCQADAGGPSFDLGALAAQYAPRLRFDQESGTGAGEQSKCFPGDPGAYFAARANGADPISLCNKNYASVQNNQIPTYYVANQVGTNAVLIRYWYFYAWQSTCFASAGSHAADWESMAVLVVGGQLRRVAWFQHGGWYSREAGDFQTVGSHPVGYVGKNAHGSYHDDGGSGGCLYFEDFRNPGGNDFRMDTWNHLVPLRRGGDAPAWMNCQGSGCFDGVGHPIEQTGDLRGLGGCGKDGCGRTSVGDNMPFSNDPTGADFSTVFAEHSGRTIDVPGASTADGVKLHQFSSTGADNQRWLLESTGDGFFTLRARHSDKCMDVTGASNAAGATVEQHGCNGGNNQRFRLLSYGNEYFALQAKHSNQCLDIAGGALNDGGQLVQWPCAWTTNESFRFEP